MLSSFLVNNNNNDDGSSTMPTELQDILLLDRHRSIADWIALMKVSDPLRLVARPSSTNSDPRGSSSSSWADLDPAATSDLLLGGGRSGSKAAGKSERYKTELCRSFEETGFCKYKEKCQFAHGFTELRNVQRHPKYKTDLCRTYHSTGFCPYGSRCHFVHAELTPLTTTTTTTTTGPPSRPPPGTSELQVDRDIRTKIDGSLASPDQGGGISLERLEQYLDTFNRVLRAFSHCPPQSPPSPPSPNSFDVLARQDSVSSGSMRSTPDRLSCGPEKAWNGYSRYSTCSSDNEVFGGGYGSVLQSPLSPPAPLFGPNAPQESLSSSGLSNSNFWARTTTALNHHHHHQHPLSHLFSQTSN